MIQLEKKVSFEGKGDVLVKELKVSDAYILINKKEEDYDEARLENRTFFCLFGGRTSYFFLFQISTGMSIQQVEEMDLSMSQIHHLFDIVEEVNSSFLSRRAEIIKVMQVSQPEEVEKDSSSNSD